MLSHLGLPELGLVFLLGMFLFGPERLPGLTQDAARLLQQVRTWGKGLREELRTELGPDLGDLDLVSLHHRTFLRHHLLEDRPAPAPIHLGAPATPPPDARAADVQGARARRAVATNNAVGWPD